MSNVNYIHRYIDSRDGKHYITIRVERLHPVGPGFEYKMTVAFCTGTNFSYKVSRDITNGRTKFPELSIILTRHVQKNESFAKRFLYDAITLVRAKPYITNMGNGIPYWFKNAHISDFKIPGRIARGKRKVRKPKKHPEGGC